MLERVQDRVRRGARRAVFAALAGVCAAIGAGFASFAGFAGLREAGLSPALAGLILACVWFGLGGVCLIVRELIGDDGARAQRQRDAAYFAHQEDTADATRRNGPTPPLAEAFSAGLAEGSAFAARKKGH